MEIFIPTNNKNDIFPENSPRFSHISFLNTDFIIIKTTSVCMKHNTPYGTEILDNTLLKFFISS